MKIALFGSNQLQFSKVYTPEVLKKLGEYGDLSPRISHSNIAEYKDFLKLYDIEFDERYLLRD